MRVSGLAAAAVEAFLPALCATCSAPLPAGSRGLCPACWSAVLPDPAPRCARCGLPWEAADEGPCPGCREAPPPHLETRVWGEHDGLLRRAVLLAKHGKCDELIRPLAQRLAAAVSGLNGPVDVVAEVPSHRLRGVLRGVVLARELAAAVAGRLGLPHRSLLVRHGLHRQAGRSRAARRALPARAFSASARTRGLHVLLVDDVMTTGTTIRRAAAALLGAGAASVRCAVLAAAPDPRRLP